MVNMCPNTRVSIITNLKQRTDLNKAYSCEVDIIFAFFRRQGDYLEKH